MQLSSFLEKLRIAPETIEFEDAIAVIDKTYHFKPTTFTNGDQVNNAGTNSGSCKIFAFGQLNKLPPKQVLHCFGHFYRKDVLENPEGNDHQNIRHFMMSGWGGVHFLETVLTEK